MQDIPAFGNHLPVKVRFGEGVAGTLPEVLSEIGAVRVFLMVDEGIERPQPGRRHTDRRTHRIGRSDDHPIR